MIYVFVAICLFGGALARGRERICPNVSRMENFDKTKFMGQWYVVKEAEQYDVIYCTSVNWYIKKGAVYSYVKYRTPSPNNGSTLMTRSDRLPGGSIEKLVLSTDYDSFAVLYTCDSLGPSSTQIITRARHPANEVITLARAVIEEEFGDVNLYDVDQSNCSPATPTRN